MRKLLELLNTPQGCHFLEENGVFIDRSTFLKQLVSPVKSDLFTPLKNNNQKIICSYQQLALDYRQSILCKISEFGNFRSEEISNLFIWMDTDQSGSNKLMRRFSWIDEGKIHKIPLVSAHSVKNIESRFVVLKRGSLKTNIDYFEDVVRHSQNKNRKILLNRISALKEILLQKEEVFLSDLSFDLTQFLLTACQYPKISHLNLSNLLIRDNFLVKEVENILNNIEDFVQNINQSIKKLADLGIDVLLPIFPETYLPLCFSCTVCASRIHLTHTRIQKEHFAAGTCFCGQDYRFSLGRSGSLSLEELAQTKRWSPSVWLPLFLNDFVSGYIGGVSSALYSIPFNQAMSTILGKKPVPIFIPPTLAQAVTSEKTLMNEYLEANLMDEKSHD